MSIFHHHVFDEGEPHPDKQCVNVKMKMYKNADSKCTIMAKYFQIKYNLSGSDWSELQKRYLREGEIYAERKSGGKY